MRIEKTSGFTLVELVITLAVTLIILIAASAGFQSFSNRQKIYTVSSDLVSSLLLARSEAARRSNSVSVCAATNSNFDSCGNDWTQGWLIFVNPDENNTFANDQTESLIRVQQPTTSGITITTVPAARGTATYNSAGFADAGTANLVFEISYAECTGNNARRLSISNTGRITVANIPCP